MGKIVKSVAWGYAGAVIAGLLIAVIGVVLGLSEATVAAAAAPTGIVFGMLGLSLVWLRPARPRARAKVATKR
jgi:hypothetical protein